MGRIADGLGCGIIDRIQFPNPFGNDWSGVREEWGEEREERGGRREERGRANITCMEQGNL